MHILTYKIATIFYILFFAGCASKYLYISEVQTVEEKECRAIMQAYSKGTGKKVDSKISSLDSCTPYLSDFLQANPFIFIMKVVKDVNDLSLTAPITFATEGGFVIVKWVPQGSYFQNHIFPGDTIKSMNGKDVVVDSVFKLSLIRQVGDTLIFGIRNGSGTELDKRVVVNSFRAKSYITKEVGSNSIYLYPSIIDDSFVKEFITISSREVVDTIYLDLRGVQGGALNSIIKYLEFITPKNEIAMKVANDNILSDTLTIYGDNDQSKSTKIFVFTDRLTSSGAEILADAMKHYKVATIIGDNTRGIPIVYNVAFGEGEYGIMYKSGELLSPSLQSLYRVGCIPDYNLNEVHNLGVIYDIFSQTKQISGTLESSPNK